MWEGGSFANYAQQVGIWRRVTNLGAAKRASALTSYMDSVVREVCMAAGGDRVMGQGGAMEILRRTRLVRPTRKLRACCNSDAPRRGRMSSRRVSSYCAARGSKKMQVGGTSPEAPSSALRMQVASFPRPGESLVWAGAQGCMGISTVA